MDAEDKQKETAFATNRAKKQLDFAIEGMWDARARGNKEDLDFYKEAILRSATALLEWVTKITVKS